MQRTVPRVAEAGARHIPASATVHHRCRQAVGCGAGHSSSDTPSETPVIQILRHCTANISGRTQRGKLSDVYVALCTLQRPPFLHRPTCPAPPNRSSTRDRARDERRACRLRATFACASHGARGKQPRRGTRHQTPRSIFVRALFICRSEESSVTSSVT